MILNVLWTLDMEWNSFFPQILLVRTGTSKVTRNPWSECLTNIVHRTNLGLLCHSRITVCWNDGCDLVMSVKSIIWNALCNYCIYKLNVQTVLTLCKIEFAGILGLDRCDTGKVLLSSPGVWWLLHPAVWKTGLSCLQLMIDMSDESTLLKEIDNFYLFMVFYWKKNTIISNSVIVYCGYK